MAQLQCLNHCTYCGQKISSFKNGEPPSGEVCCIATCGGCGELLACTRAANGVDYEISNFDYAYLHKWFDEADRLEMRNVQEKAWQELGQWG